LVHQNWCMDQQAQHDADVVEISRQVKQFYEANKHFRVYHGTTSSTRPMSFQAHSIVDTSRLTRIFPIDVSKRTVWVEPNVPMDALVNATLRKGLVPQVVMELVGITVGGGYSGTSGESSSFKYGMFEETINEIEIVLGNGTLMRASRDSNAELLNWAGSSLGTFGVVTLLEVQLIEAKRFVRLHFQRIHGAAEALRLMETAIREPSSDFVDGILLKENLGLVMTGRLADDAESVKVQSFAGRSDPWFSSYIEGVATDKTREPSSIAIPLTDYLFRWDRGVFWGGKLAFQYFHVPLNRVTRWILDPLLRSRVCYHALHEGGFASKYIIQDFAIPSRHVPDFISYVLGQMPGFQFYICPARTLAEHGLVDRLRQQSPEVNRLAHEDRIIGVGVYGPGPRDPAAFIQLNRDLETKTWKDFHGSKLLYAHVYYTDGEFWDIYDRARYEAARKTYHAENLLSIHDKIRMDMLSGRKPPSRFAGYYGAVKAALGLVSKSRRDYLMVKSRGDKSK